MKTIIEMAREYAIGGLEFDAEGLERFVNDVRAAEREACANLCDALAVHPEYASEVTKLAAMAIRARGNT